MEPQISDLCHGAPNSKLLSQNSQAKNLSENETFLPANYKESS